MLTTPLSFQYHEQGGTTLPHQFPTNCIRPVLDCLNKLFHGLDEAAIELFPRQLSLVRLLFGPKQDFMTKFQHGLTQSS